MTPMQRAIVLARQGIGTTSPNPSVGAIIVKNGHIVGEGFTLPAGQHHAEIVALTQAGAAAQGATLYTTMEPCCHFGRTPPCTRALIASGIREVHFSIIDPNPLVSGQGSAELQAAGIEVVRGEEAEAAAELYEAFAKYVTKKCPFIRIKFAMSLDGKIATHTGDSKWITGSEARALVQQMRREADAVMVGVNTVLADDPQLTCRDEHGVPVARQPLRVVADSAGRMPADAQLLRQPGLSLLAVTARASQERVSRLSAAGAEIFLAPQDAQGMVDLGAVLDELGRRGIVSLTVEGGETILGSLFDAGLVDKVFAFIAPVIVGGRGALSPVAGRGAPRLAEALRLERLKVQSVGNDWLLSGYPGLKR